MKISRKELNIIAGILAALVLTVIIWGYVHGADSVHTQVSDGIEFISTIKIKLWRKYLLWRR